MVSRATNAAYMHNNAADMILKDDPRTNVYLPF